MKLTKVLLTACGVLVLTGVFAQAKMEYGLKGGMNYSSLNLSGNGKLGSVNYHSDLGYHIGGYALFKMPRFGIQPEIIYSRQGQYFTTPNYANLHTSISYINIPVVVKYYMGPIINVQLGAQMGLVAGSRGDLIQLSGGYLGQSISGQDLKGYLKSTDFAIVMGAGVDLPFDTSITIRYIDGLSDINKYSNAPSLPGSVTPSFSTAYTRNQVLQVSVGYKWRKLGK